MLNLPDVDTLHYEGLYLSRYIDEGYLFKVGLSTHPKSYRQLSNLQRLLINDQGIRASKKKKAEEILIVTSKDHHISPSKSHILEDVLKHQCLVQHMDLEIEMTKTLNDWNNEFVKVKYLQGECKKKYNG
ncbi:hypothetical protein IEQ34_011075 [Dendrobium chrysotoxum]|uniref:GIY-YIG homing endonuclease n=1 Tax=Dendrobium chrysotoxum TaxID=161865 RepID=A0AAV7GXZ9_DENCH|nr:hypothetical protein IEQ34_011075 [Dendrobium chrysotoxum]